MRGLGQLPKTTAIPEGPVNLRVQLNIAEIPAGQPGSFKSSITLISKEDPDENTFSTHRFEVEATAS
jgi:hypothetical protein